ncbi:hypothetical protein [Methanosarcina sp.]|uniref:hypothetical protein n=1 Tax=Methanosarcina sp. TaxID=2213 RepID=UPI003BB76FF1
MKTGTKILIGFSLAILAICLVFFLTLFHPPGSGEYVIANKLQDMPEKYVELSLTDLEKYPYVKQAIMNPGSDIKIPSDRYEEMSEFLKKLNETNYVKVNNEYYEIWFMSAD